MRETGFHQQFAAMLRGGDIRSFAQFAGLGGAAGLPVYRNTVVRGAIDVLGDNYPAVRTLSGDRNFAVFAKTYWSLHPPRDGVMTLYGAGFAEVIAAESPPGMPDILPEIARLDRAWLEAHHAPDAVVLTPGDLTGVEPERLADLTLRLHPSVRLPRSRRAIHASWAAARFEGRMVKAGPETGETILVRRPRHDVCHRALETIEAALLDQLAAGVPLGRAAERAGSGIDPFIRLLKDGVFARD